MPGNDLVIEAFTELAPHYEATMDRELRHFWGLRYADLVDRLIRAARLQADDTILDVATGTAFIPLRIRRELGDRVRIVGLDITLPMLQQAQKNVRATPSPSCISLVCASAMALPFPKGFLDAVICGLGTHHMDLPSMLSEMRRVLKRGGKLILTDVGASPFWRSFCGHLLLRILLLGYGLARGSARSRAEVEAFPNVRTADEWHTLLSQYGFVRIEITESPARRAWYPCALTMSAVAGET